MPTVRDVLLQSGLSDEQITALDQKAVAAFERLHTESISAREAAELANRAQVEMYEKQIVPALNGWGNEKAALEARAAYYEQLAKQGQAAGFVPPAAPGDAPPPRDQGGRYVANTNAVPGSPDFQKLRDDMAGAVLSLSQLNLKHQRLYGSPLPDDYEPLLKEANAQHMPLNDWVAKKYAFADKEAEIAKKKRDEEREAIRKEAIAEVEKKYAEREANPTLKRGESSRFTQLNKSVAKGELKDPLQMTPDQRRAQTRAAIQRETQQAEMVQ
jgi:hypothetical protein